MNNSTRAQYENYMLALRKWREKQGIVDYAPTTLGEIGRMRGASMMPVSPHQPGQVAKDEPYKYSPTSVPKTWTPSAVDKVLGRLEAGGYVDPMTGRRFEWKTREQLEFHALSTLGKDWKERVPQALEIIDKKFPTEKPKPIETKKSWWME